MILLYLEPKYVGQCVNGDVPDDIPKLCKQVSLKRFTAVAEYVHFTFENDDDKAAFMQHAKESLKGMGFDEKHIELIDGIDDGGNHYQDIRMPLFYMFLMVFTIRD